MSIILKDFNIKCVYFEIETNKTPRCYTSTFARINYSNEFMTLKNICINYTALAINIEHYILNKYLSYMTKYKPDVGYNRTPCYAVKNVSDINKIIKISGIWENSSGLFGIAFKTF